MIFRKAKLTDVPAIVDIAVESVSRDPLPVKISREAMAETAKVCLNPAHFMWVAEDSDGKVVAAVAACVQQGFWFERMQCSVLLFYTRVPGAGLPLLAAHLWARGGCRLCMAATARQAGRKTARSSWVLMRKARCCRWATRVSGQ